MVFELVLKGCFFIFLYTVKNNIQKFKQKASAFHNNSVKNGLNSSIKIILKHDIPEAGEKDREDFVIRKTYIFCFYIVVMVLF